MSPVNTLPMMRWDVRFRSVYPTSQLFALQPFTPAFDLCMSRCTWVSAPGRVLSRSWRYPHEGAPAHVWAVAPCVAIVEFDDGILFKSITPGHLHSTHRF